MDKSRRFASWLTLSLVAHAAVLGAVTHVAERAAEPEGGEPAPPILAGDTAEMPGTEVLTFAAEADEVDVDLDGVDLDVGAEAQSAADVGAEAQSAPAGSPARRSRSSKRTLVRGAPRPSSTESAEPTAGGGEPVLFGAVGERGAVDLATAFTRGFAHAASADPIWARAAFGSAGSTLVVLRLDESGHLAEASIEPGGTPALRQGLSRTVALVRGRKFTARASTTRLHVSGRVSADAVKSGAYGDVFAIGGTYTGRAGTAFFSLAIGRRVDVTITDRTR